MDISKAQSAMTKLAEAQTAAKQQQQARYPTPPHTSPPRRARARLLRRRCWGHLFKCFAIRQAASNVMCVS